MKSKYPRTSGNCAIESFSMIVDKNKRLKESWHHVISRGLLSRDPEPNGLFLSWNLFEFQRNLTSSNGDLNAELRGLNNILGIASTHVVRLEHCMIQSLLVVVSISLQVDRRSLSCPQRRLMAAEGVQLGEAGSEGMHATKGGCGRILSLKSERYWMSWRDVRHVAVSRRSLDTRERHSVPPLLHNFKTFVVLFSSSTLYPFFFALLDSVVAF